MIYLLTTWCRATPVCGFLLFLSQRPGAPDQDRFGVMRAVAISLALAWAMLAAQGCARTYVGHGARSPDGKTILDVTCHGAVGRAYSDNTAKLVDVWIGPLYRKSDREALFTHRYKYHGADVYWDIRWNSSEAVTVDVFDYGDGVLASDGAKAGAQSNHIATMGYALDKPIGKFIEQKP